MQLDEVRGQIDKTLHSLQSLFSQIRRQDAFSMKRDRAFGSRIHTVRIVWDEFSPDELTEILPRIKALHAEYLAQREVERDILFNLSIGRAIESRNAATGSGRPQP